MASKKKKKLFRDLVKQKKIQFKRENQNCWQLCNITAIYIVKRVWNSTAQIK